jgi:lysophospholipid acyltransferase (LPLAT)-like uncharacterized protein
MSAIHVNELDFRRRLILWPVAALARLWGWTWRMEAAEEDQRRLRDGAEPTLFLIWHNRLFLVAETRRRFRSNRPIYGLVSASKDGAWLAAFFQMVGVRTVRGSSSRGGRQALRDLSARLAEGHDVALTPDGPRGPLYSFKPGAAILARRGKARVFLVHFDCESAWRLKSWDRFLLPKPFARVTFRCRPVQVETLPRDLTACAEVLRSQFLALGTKPKGEAEPEH